MSRFPAQFVDMTVERGLFDHTGAQPPATRITVELPPEYIEKPDPDATPPYSNAGVDPKILADIQTAVMREYGGVARRCLNAFRQDVGLGDLAVNGRRTMLGEGVGMNYASQFGNESIRIHVSKEGVRRLIGSQEDLYMLVLHTKGGGYGAGNGGEHWVAAIPMKDIDSPAGKVAYSKKLETSVFTDRYNIPGGHSQFKISKDHHVLVTPIQFHEDGTVSGPPGNGILSYSDTKISLFKKATTTRPPDLSPFNTSYDMALINWNGNTVYDSFGNKAEFSNTGITVTQDRPWVKRPWAVAAVDENGGIYGTAGLSTTFSLLSTYVWPTLSQAQDDAENALPNYSYTAVSSGPGEADVTLAGQNGSQLTGGSYLVTADFRFPRHTTVNGLDKLTVVSSPISASGEDGVFIHYFDQVDFFGKTGRGEYTTDGSGWWYTYTGETQFDWQPQYAVGETPSDVIFTYMNTNNGNFDTYDGTSPIGELPDARSAYSIGFSANGETSIGLFLYYTWDPVAFTGGEAVFKIHRGNTDYTDTLYSALGIAEPDLVYMVLLDIKLSDIKKLK